MMYMRTKAGQHIVVLEPGNIELLQKGQPVITEGKQVMIVYTPDIMWLQKQFVEHVKSQEGGKTFEPAMLNEMLAKGMKRPVVMRMETENTPPPNNIIKDGEVVEQPETKVPDPETKAADPETPAEPAHEG
jgi:hypothetical protein